MALALSTGRRLKLLAYCLLAIVDLKLQSAWKDFENRQGKTDCNFKSNFLVVVSTPLLCISDARPCEALASHGWPTLQATCVYNTRNHWSKKWQKKRKVSNSKNVSSKLLEPCAVKAARTVLWGGKPERAYLSQHVQDCLYQGFESLHLQNCRSPLLRQSGVSPIPRLTSDLVFYGHNQIDKNVVLERLFTYT